MRLSREPAEVPSRLSTVSVANNAFPCRETVHTSHRYRRIPLSLFALDWPFDLFKVGEVVVPTTEERAGRVCSLLVVVMSGVVLHRPLLLRHRKSGDFAFLVWQRCQEEDQETLNEILLNSVIST